MKKAKEGTKMNTPIQALITTNYKGQLIGFKAVATHDQELTPSLIKAAAKPIPLGAESVAPVETTKIDELYTAYLPNPKGQKKNAHRYAFPLPPIDVTQPLTLIVATTFNNYVPQMPYVWLVDVDQASSILDRLAEQGRMNNQPLQTVGKVQRHSRLSGFRIGQGPNTSLIAVRDLEPNTITEK